MVGISFFDSESGDGGRTVLSMKSIIILCILCLVIGFVSGWGGWINQSSDFAKHNAVLNDLIEYQWPVYYKEAINPSMLTYYLGSYLVPALVGKAFGSFEAGEFASYLWLEIGFILVVVRLCAILKADTLKKQMITLLITVFFCGCFILSQRVYAIFTGVLSTNMHWMTKNNNILLQYRSNFVNLRWVAHQSIPCWLAVTILWEFRDKVKYYSFFVLPIFLDGVFPFMGLVFLLMFFLAFNCDHIYKVQINAKSIKYHAIFLKNIFSIENLVVALCGGIPILLYYLGGVVGTDNTVNKLRFQFPDIWQYISFVTFMFLIYSVVVWRQFSNDGLFVGANVLMLIVPFFVLGKNNDLVMNITIPTTFIIMISTLTYLFSEKANKALKVLLCVFLLLGAIYEFKEIESIVLTQIGKDWEQTRTYDGNSLEGFSDLINPIEKIDLKYNYFSYNIDSNIFIDYLSPRAY